MQVIRLSGDTVIFGYLHANRMLAQMKFCNAISIVDEELWDRCYRFRCFKRIVQPKMTFRKNLYTLMTAKYQIFFVLFFLMQLYEQSNGLMYFTV